MAKLEEARLSTAGSGAELVMRLEVEIDWDRGDDDLEWELQARFVGDDALLRGRDDVLLVHAVPVSPAGGRQQTVDVGGAGGVFDEDRGTDEVKALVELRARTADSRVITTNSVSGDFSG